jgi:hypothetical protein
MSLRFQISDLLAHPGQAREEAAVLPVDVGLSNAAVDDDVVVTVTLRSLTDGVVVRGTAETTVDLTCNRCLTGWSEDLSVPIERCSGSNRRTRTTSSRSSPGGGSISNRWSTTRWRWRFRPGRCAGMDASDFARRAEPT